jgi:methyl-accepting chemotaxis protein
MRIGLRIGVIIAGVVILTAGSQLWFLGSHHAETVSQALKSKALPLTKLAAEEISEPLEFNAADEMNKVLQSFLSEPDAVFAALFDASGKLVAQAGAFESIKPKRVEQSTAAFEDDRLRVDHPVSTKSGFDGVLVTGFSTRAADIERRDALRRGALISIVIAFLAILLGLGYGTLLGRRLGAIAQESERTAGGDLSRPTLENESNDEVGRVVRAFNSMVQSQAQLVRQTHETAIQLNSTGRQFLATAQQQERGATEQSSAVEETNRTLTSLLGSAREIAQAAQGVTRNAELTQDNSRQMAARIGELSRQVERITEILELIKGIASKSEILALNAALEGTKAGEAGRGFSLVASQMQRLAENVMEAVADIRSLTVSIREATQSSVMATEESTKLTADTTRSARQIELIIEHQQSATEQVATAMHDVASVATQTATASKEIVSSTQDILRLCERLTALVDQYKLAPQSNKPARDG